MLLGMQYMFLNQGHGRTNHVHAGAFLKTHERLDRPDMQLHFVNAVISGHKMPQLAGDGFSIHMNQLRPESRGEVRLASPNPFVSPVIDPRFLTSELDLRTMRDGVRVVREIISQDALSFYRGDEISPGDDVSDDTAIDNWIRRTGESIFHPVGTVRMGADDAAPVDCELKLRGVGNLRIVDASVMPALVGGNTNAAVIMIAEKAADLIRGRTPLPRLDVPVAEDVQTKAFVHQA